MKQTKIVASISDRRCDQDFIRKLFFAGMKSVCVDVDSLFSCFTQEHHCLSPITQEF